MWIGPKEIAIIHNLAPELWATKVTWGAILKSNINSLAIGDA